jgi:hypothetical protein
MIRQCNAEKVAAGTYCRTRSTYIAWGQINVSGASYNGSLCFRGIYPLASVLAWLSLTSRSCHWCTLNLNLQGDIIVVYAWITNTNQTRCMSHPMTYKLCLESAKSASLWQRRSRSISRSAAVYYHSSIRNVAFFSSACRLLQLPKMKRGAPAASPKAGPKSKKPRVEVPEYHLTPSLRDEHGEAIWPAPKDQIEKARSIIKEW